MTAADQLEQPRFAVRRPDGSVIQTRPAPRENALVEAFYADNLLADLIRPVVRAEGWPAAEASAARVGYTLVRAAVVEVP